MWSGRLGGCRILVAMSSTWRNCSNTPSARTWEESRYLRSHGWARRAIKEIMEMPDHQIDRVIRSAEANQGQLSRMLAKEIPALAEDGIWEAIREAIQDAFREDRPGS